MWASFLLQLKVMEVMVVLLLGGLPDPSSAPRLLQGSADLLWLTVLVLLFLFKKAYLFADQLVCPFRLLIERFGYPNTFLITAGLKLIAYLPLVPLLAFVDDGVLKIRRLHRQDAAHPNLQEPLLS